VALERAKRDLSEVRQVERLQQESIDRDRAEFLRYQTELQERHKELCRSHEALQQHHEELQQRHEEALRQTDAVTARLNAIETSRSWRWTGVFRRLARLVKGRPS
jgi:hypothetical protein